MVGVLGVVGCAGSVGLTVSEGTVSEDTESCVSSGCVSGVVFAVESVAMVVPAVLAGRVSCGAAGAQAVSNIQITSTKDNFFKIVKILSVYIWFIILYSEKIFNY